MAEAVIAYTKDGMWRVDLVAFMLNDFVYKAIGSTIRAYHWEVGGACGGARSGGLRNRWISLASRTLTRASCHRRNPAMLYRETWRRTPLPVTVVNGHSGCLVPSAWISTLGV